MGRDGEKIKPIKANFKRYECILLILQEIATALRASQ